MIHPELILTAPAIVQFHVYAAVAAILLTPFTIFRRRRDRLHKMAGYAWVTAMFVTALSSMFMHGIQLVGPFSPIHLLSILTFWGLFEGVRAAIRKDIRTHEKTMKSLAVGALGIAGLFTLVPGRLLNRAVFGENGVEGFTAAVTLFVVAVILQTVLQNRRRSRAG